jgi:hypothetical protein
MKVFLLFCLTMQGSGSVQIMMDPLRIRKAQKAYGSYGSGSTTIIKS